MAEANMEDLNEGLSPEEKKQHLFLRQKALLDQFLKTGAITQAQYEKSLGDLSEKMGYSEFCGSREKA